MTGTPPPLDGVRVGLDLDGVCVDYVGYMREFLVRSGRLAPLPDPVDFRLVEWFDTDDDRIAAHRSAVAAGLHRDAPAVPGAAAGVARLRELGATAMAVSARGTYQEDDTQLHADVAKWAARHGITFDGVHFGRPKAAADCDIFLDDSPDDIAALRADGRIAVVFDQPWNRHLAAPRAQGWGDVPTRLIAALGRTA